MKKAVIFMLMALFLPSVSAGILPVNCNFLSDWQVQECQNILGDGSLQLGQKEDLYLNLVESQEVLPSHEFVYNWNKKIDLKSVPENVVPKMFLYEKGVILEWSMIGLFLEKRVN